MCFLRQLLTTVHLVTCSDISNQTGQKGIVRHHRGLKFFPYFTVIMVLFIFITFKTCDSYHGYWRMSMQNRQNCSCEVFCHHLWCALYFVTFQHLSFWQWRTITVWLHVWSSFACLIIVAATWNYFSIFSFTLRMRNNVERPQPGQARPQRKVIQSICQVLMWQWWNS